MSGRSPPSNGPFARPLARPPGDAVFGGRRGREGVHRASTAALLKDRMDCKITQRMMTSAAWRMPTQSVSTSLAIKHPLGWCGRWAGLGPTRKTQMNTHWCCGFSLCRLCRVRLLRAWFSVFLSGWYLLESATSIRTPHSDRRDTPQTYAGCSSEGRIGPAILGIPHNWKTLLKIHLR